MTVHVAEATEGRGRVILRCSAWAANDVAIEAAVLVASAFQSEVEVLLVEDTQRVDFASFPLAREFSARDGKSRPVSPRAVRAEVHGSFSDVRKRVAAIASDLEVNVYEHVVRDEPVQALVSACARRGPWNMIAIAETCNSPATFSLDEVFDTVSDATGIIVTGPEAQLRSRIKSQANSIAPRSKGIRAASGPVVLAVEDSGRLQGMVRAGRYLASSLETEVVVLLVAGTDAELAQMDGEVRLVLAEQGDVGIARMRATHEDQAAVAEAVRCLDSSFVIAQFGGVAAPRSKSLRPLICALQCPLLLVR